MSVIIKLTPVELGEMKEIIHQLETYTLASTKRKLLSKLLSFLSIIESIRGNGKLIKPKLISVVKQYDVETDDIIYFFTILEGE